MADDPKHESVIWIGRAGGQEMARRIARAGARFLRAEGRPNPADPAAYLWRVIERGDDGAERVTLADDGSEEFNDSWLCPPRCW